MRKNENEKKLKWGKKLKWEKVKMEKVKMGIENLSGDMKGNDGKTIKQQNQKNEGGKYSKRKDQRKAEEKS